MSCGAPRGTGKFVKTASRLRVARGGDRERVAREISASRGPFRCHISGLHPRTRPVAARLAVFLVFELPHGSFTSFLVTKQRHSLFKRCLSAQPGRKGFESSREVARYRDSRVRFLLAA